MIVWGVNALNHDAAITVLDGRSIVFAAHAERYSRCKNDSHLNAELIQEALQFGYPDVIAWYENPWGRRLRYLKAGQYRRCWEQLPRSYLRQFGIDARLEYGSHHRSHLAAAFFTSGLPEAAGVVIDAIGETTTASIWKCSGTSLTCLWEMRYPQSLGLFYSAVTRQAGLKPNEEEYILMGMAAYGRRRPELVQQMREDLRSGYNFHRGSNYSGTNFELAAAAQEVITTEVVAICRRAMEMCGTQNLVYGGGVALNCVANSAIANSGARLWIMPNPGDAGSSLGAAAAVVGQRLQWQDPYLGTDIGCRTDPDAVVRQLLDTGICGVAVDRAEFGPRALGNRSLLADPRKPDIRDRVNAIKRRQKFRPFAPAVLEGYQQLFQLPPGVDSSPYMQFTCGADARRFPAVVHADGTARLQTVGPAAGFLHQVLKRWLYHTGCPVLLNTSLNIRGEPLVNTVADGQRFSRLYGVPVL